MIEGSCHCGAVRIEVDRRHEETSHFQVTKGMLDSPERYWKHLRARDEEDG